MPTKTICDHCKTPITARILTEPTSGGGEQWHFTCPHCHHRYNICRITPHGVELRRQIDSLKAQLRLAPHRTDLATQRDTLLSQLTAEITDLT